MMTHRSYVVATLNAAELEIAQTAGTKLLYRGDARGLARFFAELPQESLYAIFSGPVVITPTGCEGLLTAELLRLEAHAAQLEAEMVGLRARLPIPASGSELKETAGDRASEAAAILEVCVYDHLKSLRGALRAAAHFEPSTQEEAG